MHRVPEILHQFAGIVDSGDVQGMIGALGDTEQNHAAFRIGECTVRLPYTTRQSTFRTLRLKAIVFVQTWNLTLPPVISECGIRKDAIIGYALTHIATAFALLFVHCRHFAAAPIILPPLYDILPPLFRHSGGESATTAGNKNPDTPGFQSLYGNTASASLRQGPAGSAPHYQPATAAKQCRDRPTDPANQGIRLRVRIRWAAPVRAWPAGSSA